MEIHGSDYFPLKKLKRFARVLTEDQLWGYVKYQHIGLNISVTINSILYSILTQITSWGVEK